MTFRRGTHLLSRGSILFIAIGIFAVSALAQTNKADIVGTITDSNGAAVQGATVTITKVDTNATRTVKSGDSGEYQVPGLEIGTYKVVATKQGFQTVTQENIVLQTNDRLRIDLTLTPGDVTAAVTVTAGAPLVETESSDRGAVITGRQITELPLSGRNFTQLATLTPGVARANSVGLGGGPEARSFNNGDPRSGSGGPGASDANGSSESSRFNRSGGAAISANGQRATNNNFSLDGVDNNEPQFGTIGTFPNPDAIAEFKVTTSVPPAEVGRAAGAVITATIQSGTNQFHGSAYYYGQSSRLNAYHPVLKTKLGELLSTSNPSPVEVAALTKPVTQVNEFGGTFGGPIIKNRTFFFFDFSGTRNRLPFPAQTTVPTAGSRNGDFSDFPQIFNPFTGQPFTNNIIPSNLIAPVGRNYLNAFALPTRNIFNPQDGKDNVSQANFFTQRANTERINAPEIKIDHKLSNKNALSGRFTNQPLTTLRANIIPGNIPTAGFGAGEERGNSRQIAISDTHTFSPSVLNEFKFGLTQIQISIFNCGVGGACGVSPTFAKDIGIPNANDGTLEASGGSLIGGFNTGFLEFTGDGGLFQVKSKNPYFADTLSIVHGRHVTKFGGELRLRRLNTIDGGRTGTLKGQFQYADKGPFARAIQPGQVCPAQSQTSVNGQPACFVRPDGIPYGGTGNQQANILMGLPADLVTKSKIFGGPFNLRSQEWGLFVQDDWKVNDRLTLNLGLRYDLFLPFSEADGRYSLFSVEQQKVIVASGGGDRIISADKNNFGPRIGLAYALNKSRTLVFRGGYGLLYTLDGVDYPPGVRNVPFSNSISIQQTGTDNDNFSFALFPNSTTFSMVTGPPTVPSPPDPANVPTNFGVFAVDPKQKNGMVHQWQASVQYQFAKDYSIDIGYVANRSRNLLFTNDIGTSGTAQARNSTGQFFGSAIIYTNGASSRYDGLQVQLQKRYSRNIQGQVSYTWSRTIDNSTGVFNGLGDSRNGRGGPINPFNIDQDKGRSSLDFPQLLSANALIDLPFGKGRRYLNQGGAADKIFGGWELNPLFTARSGLPFSVVCTNCNGANRPTQIGDPFANLAPGRLLNAAAFTLDPTKLGSVTNAAGNTIRFGLLPRNTFRGPAYFSWDLSVLKTTPITERMKMQIGFQFFNLFNHLNFTIPQNDINQGDFGLIKYNAYPGRVIQYSAKFLF
jgi:Carboxypeptidase regulatory-like domain/TonB dependent receptor